MLQYAFPNNLENKEEAQRISITIVPMLFAPNQVQALQNMADSGNGDPYIEKHHTAIKSKKFTCGH